MCSNESVCNLLEYDDSHCTNIAKCCVGISDQGDHAKCTQAARKCRNFGNIWEPRRPMKPLPFEYIYNDTPGYATTGKFVREDFSGGDIKTLFEKMFNLQCLIKNIIYSLIISTLIFCIMDKPLVPSQIATLSIVSSMARCLLF